MRAVRERGLPLSRLRRQLPSKGSLIGALHHSLPLHKGALGAVDDTNCVNLGKKFLDIGGIGYEEDFSIFIMLDDAIIAVGDAGGGGEDAGSV